MVGHENKGAKRELLTLGRVHERFLEKLAAALRRAFSGKLAGNLKAGGIAAATALAPIEIRGGKVMLQPVETMLNASVKQSRMQLPGWAYHPRCRIVP